MILSTIRSLISNRFDVKLVLGINILLDVLFCGDLIISYGSVYAYSFFRYVCVRMEFIVCKIGVNKNSFFDVKFCIGYFSILHYCFGS